MRTHAHTHTLPFHTLLRGESGDAFGEGGEEGRNYASLHCCCYFPGTQASNRNGDPLPPLIFIGAATR